MNYLQAKKRAFMQLAASVKGFVRTVSGTPPVTVEHCIDYNSIIDYVIYGNSGQGGNGVGEYDEESGKYKIPIIASGFDLHNDEYASVTVPIYLDEPLCRIEDITDSITQNNVIYNTAKGTLNGTESWTKSTASSNYCRFYSTSIPNILGIGTNKKSIISDMFTGYSWQAIRNAGLEGIAVYSNGRIDISIAKSRLASCDASGLKQWLGANNVNYAAVSNTRELPVSMPVLPTFPGTTRYTADTSIQPSRFDVTYYATQKEDWNV